MSESLLVQDDQVVLDNLRIEKLQLNQPLTNEGITLRNFQLLGAYFGQRRKKWILALEPGMGKTLTALVAHLYELLDGQMVRKSLANRKILITCPKNAVGTWIRHFTKIFGLSISDFSVVAGTPAQRKVAWAKQALVYIVTAQSLRGDVKVAKSDTIYVRVNFQNSSVIVPAWVAHPKTIWLVDEYQKFLRNTSSQVFKVMKFLTKEVEELCLITGSPASKGPQNLWCALHLCDPVKFSSYWKFVNTYCEMEESVFGKVIVGVNEFKLPELREILLEYVFRRTTASADMPEIVRWIEAITMDKIETKLYKELAEDALHLLPEGDYILNSTAVSKLMSIRKLLTSPRLIHPTYPIGTALEFVLDKLESDEISHGGIYSYFREAITTFADYIRQETDYTAYCLYGGMNYLEIQQAINSWSNDPKSIILCTIDFAQSFELLAGNFFWFIGPSHDPESLKQAERRGNRLISTEPCMCCYVVHQNSYIEDIMEAVVSNAENTRKMFDHSSKIRAIISRSLESINN